MIAIEPDANTQTGELSKLKITRTRAYTVNMGNFESFRTEASVELSNGENGDYKDYDFADLANKADEMLTSALSRDLKEAAEVTLTKDSFILTMEL